VDGGEHRRWLLGWVVRHVAGHRDGHLVMPKHLVCSLCLVGECSCQSSVELECLCLDCCLVGCYHALACGVATLHYIFLLMGQLGAGGHGRPGCEDEGITYQVSYQICKEVTEKDGIGRNQDDEQSVECL
jgi:hypothetical protein